jgi:hypothetical protein
VSSGKKDLVTYHKTHLAWEYFKGLNLLEKPQIYWMVVITRPDFIHGNAQLEKVLIEELRHLAFIKLKDTRTSDVAFSYGHIQGVQSTG